jgi:hypothetical protein
MVAKIKLTIPGAKARSKSRLGFTTATSVIIVALVLVVWGGTYLYKFYLNRKISSLEKSTNLITSQIDQEKMSQVKNLQGRLISIEQIINNHILWTKAFDDLEKNTPPEISLIDFSSNISGATMIRGVAPDYQTVAQFLTQFEKNSEIFEKPILTNVNLDRNKNVTFEINLNLKENILKKQKENE